MSLSRIPVTVVTGFLGAGKTTLLSNLLASVKQRRLAILVNEFGEVSVDGALLRDHEKSGHVEIHDLSNGLVAYSEDQDFLPIMSKILARRQIFDHVLIETSGLALPTAVMEQLQGEALRDYFVLDATLAVVDTPLLLSEAFSHTGHGESGLSGTANRSVATLFEQQLENADIVVLNKIDSLADDDLLAAESRVRTLSPNVRFIELAYEAQLDTRLTLGLRLHEESARSHGHHYGPVRSMPGADMLPLTNQAVFDGHAHTGLGAHIHGISTHKHFHKQDPGWQSFVIRSNDAQDLTEICHAVSEIARSEPMLRVKGFAILKESGEKVLIQAVRTRVEIQQQPVSPSRASSQLVFIGYHPSRPRTVELLNTLTGSTWR